MIGGTINYCRDMYNKRTWLNPETKDGTSSVVAFYGTVTDFKGRTYPSTFLEISDCQNKIRLHQTCDDSTDDFIKKLRLLRTEIEHFMIYLDKIKEEQQ